MKIHPAPIVTPINTGSMGNTSKVQLASGETYFAKVLDPNKVNSSVISTETKSKDEIITSLKNNFESEFLLLQLMNLMGLKTPTELGLVKYDSGAVLIKRSAGDGENKSFDTTDAILDSDHQTRLNTFVNTLFLGYY